MPRGVYERQHARPRPEQRPQPVPKMPPLPGGGRWRAATRRAWASWFESGRASLLDEAGLASLGRLMTLTDKAEADGWPVGLAREVRLLEASIMRSALAAPASVEEPESDSDRAERIAAFRARSKARRRSEMDELGLDEEGLARHELLALER